MTFSLNQIFDNTYPPEAAQFCNANGYVIQEIERQEGVRRFQIQAIPAPSEEELFQSLRSQRDALLQETDKYLSVSDYPISDEKKEEYRVYRQALRDLPSLPDAPWTPDTIPWPEKPDM